MYSVRNTSTQSSTYFITATKDDNLVLILTRFWVASIRCKEYCRGVTTSVDTCEGLQPHIVLGVVLGQTAMD